MPRTSGEQPKSHAIRDASVDDAEVARFAEMADEWWDPDGSFRPLHKLNPVRIGFIRDRVSTHFGRQALQPGPLAGLSVLDVGCGGGLLCEPLARLGANVTGIDAAERNVRIARTHAGRLDLDIGYRHATAEQLAAAGERFDVVVSLEVVEHVADVDAFLGACCRLVRPGGAMVLATLNRTAKSFLFGIVGAEFVMRWLPRGTHRWDRFIRPSELAAALRSGGVDVGEVAGVTYDVLADDWRLSRDVAVNYLVFAVKR